MTGGRLKFVACLFHEYSGLSFQRNATDSMVQANIDDVRNEFSNLKSLLVRDIDYNPPTRVGDLCCPGDLQCFQLWRRFSTRARDSAGRDFRRYIKIHLEAVYELFRYVFFKNII